MNAVQEDSDENRPTTRRDTERNLLTEATNRTPNNVLLKKMTVTTSGKARKNAKFLDQIQSNDQK